MLEVLTARPNKWNVLFTARQWATQKAISEKKKTPAQVLALVTADESAGLDKQHAFTLVNFIAFIATTDADRGSIGLLNM